MLARKLGDKGFLVVLIFVWVYVIYYSFVTRSLLLFLSISIPLMLFNTWVYFYTKKKRR